MNNPKTVYASIPPPQMNNSNDSLKIRELNIRERELLLEEEKLRWKMKHTEQRKGRNRSGDKLNASPVSSPVSPILPKISVDVKRQDVKHRLTIKPNLLATIYKVIDKELFLRASEEDMNKIYEVVQLDESIVDKPEVINKMLSMIVNSH